jgi:hypothetical protein
MKTKSMRSLEHTLLLPFRKAFILILSLTTISFSGLRAQNNAISFDGFDDVVDAGTNSLFNAGSIRTMECWVKFNTITGTHEILSKSTGSSGIELLILAGDLRFYCMYNPTNASYVSYPMTGNMTTGVWYHIAVSWDGTNKESMKLYVNGVSVGTATHFGNINGTGISNSGRFYIGQWSQVGDPRHHHGLIDEVRVWSVERSAADIKKGMYGEVSSSTTGLTAYYDANLGSGLVLPNSTPNAGLNGTFINGPIWVSSPVQFGHNSLAFDGADDYVRVPAKAAYEFSTGTFECWVKPTALNAAVNQCILGLRSTLGGRFSIHVTPTTLGIFNGTLYTTRPATFTNNQWYHIAVVATANTLVGYVNGVSVGTFTGTMGTAVSQDLIIGKVKTAIDDMESFVGAIDEIRIWSTAKTSVELNAAKDFTATGSEVGLLANFSFDQGVAENSNAGLTTIIDKTSGNNHGTMLGFALTGTSSNFINSNLSSTLPVTLSFFEAAKNNDRSLLIWKTASEQNSHSFVVERSTNGSDYTAIATIAAAGNSQVALNYSYSDLNPTNGKNYYRLKQVDIDGRFAYSAVRVLDFTTKDKLYWYAANKTIEVRLQNGKSENFHVTDMGGRVIKKGNLENGRASLFNLPVGTYNVQVQGKEIYNMQFVVR